MSDSIIDPLTNLFRLDGRTALVTGASSGLGWHFALTLARAGARVVAAARRRDKLAELVNEIRALGGQGHAVELDVTHAAGVRAGFDVIAELAGVPDLIVNNAGTRVDKPFLEQEEADWDQVLDTNLKGAWLVAQEGARRLVAAGRGGSIVNISSILGERVAGGVAPYAISKAALLQATRAMALELARHDIRVNALLPGYIVTDFNREWMSSEASEKVRSRIPTRRFGQPRDLDGALLLLASAAGAHITGTTLAVDGGHLLKFI
jgi:NAD(P)-dependent dehydrogenase (short-subunit alcohol dehydrogenase family)